MNNKALEYVIQEGQALLLNPELILRCQQEEKKDFSGTESPLWLGVPLKLGKKSMALWLFIIIPQRRVIIMPTE